MLVDTHCHLNFGAITERIREVVENAKRAGVEKMVVPGTDLKTSKLAVEIANKYPGVWAAVGIHPHHLFDAGQEFHNQENFLKPIDGLRELIVKDKVVAVGEVGLDKYVYQKTKYENYAITPEFVEAQKRLLIEQIKLAVEFGKALVLHNRQAVDEMLPLLTENWDKRLEKRAVFHCCEADERLLEFAKVHKMFLGVDGDITWSKKKQRFISTVPLEMLVLETDTPFLTPEPAKIESKTNEPKNVTYVRDYVAKAKGISTETVEKQTTENAMELFRISG